MKYTILNTSQNETIFTEVEFTYEDGTTEIVNIPHFNPNSIEEIQDNIQNRFESECLLRKLAKDNK